MELDNLGVMVDYAAEAGRNYLILEKRGLQTLDMIDFQVEIIANHNINGVANLQVREKNTEVKLYYNLGNRSSLVNFFRKSKIAKSEFIFILSKIGQVLLESKNNLLYDSFFILDENFIYINAKTLEVSLIYIPLDRQQNLVVNFKEFVSRLLIDSANIDTQDNFVQQVFALLKSEPFDITDFIRELKQLGEYPSEQKSNLLHRSEQATLYNVPSKWQIDPTDRTSSGTVLENCLPKKNFETGDVERLQVKKSEDSFRTKGRYLRKGFLVTLAVFSIVAAILSIREGALERIISSLGMVNLIVGGLWLLAVPSIFLIIYGWIHRNKESIGSSNQINWRKVELENSLQEYKNANKDCKHTAQKSNNLFQDCKQPPDISASQIACASERLYVEDQFICDETVVLTEIDGPLLKQVGGDEVILLNKGVLLIGRNPEVCDYAIKNPGVGRAHAEIALVEGTYFIKDLNSTNGTFINGHRLVSNKQYALKDSDCITFANLEYSYKIN